MLNKNTGAVIKVQGQEDPVTKALQENRNQGGKGPQALRLNSYFKPWNLTETRQINQLLKLLKCRGRFRRLGATGPFLLSSLTYEHSSKAAKFLHLLQNAKASYSP